MSSSRHPPLAKKHRNRDPLGSTGRAPSTTLTRHPHGRVLGDKTNTLRANNPPKPKPIDLPVLQDGETPSSSHCFTQCITQVRAERGTTNALVEDGATICKPDVFVAASSVTASDGHASRSEISTGGRSARMSRDQLMRSAYGRSEPSFGHVHSQIAQWVPHNNDHVHALPSDTSSANTSSLDSSCENAYVYELVKREFKLLPAQQQDIADVILPYSDPIALEDQNPAADEARLLGADSPPCYDVSNVTPAQVEAAVRDNQIMAACGPSTVPGFPSAPSRVLPFGLRVCDYVILKRLGSGSFGTVFHARSKASEKSLAMKVIRKSDWRRAEYVYLEQRATLKCRGNPFLLQFEASFTCGNNFYIISEYVGGGSLQDELDRKYRDFEVFDPMVAKLYMAEMVVGVLSLHKLGIVHRDLKPDNILIRPDGHLVIADFGFAAFTNRPDIGVSIQRFLTNSETEDEERENLEQESESGGVFDTVCGTRAYMAPEICLGKAYGKEVDWWALGIICHQLFTGTLPFLSNDKQTLARLIIFSDLFLNPDWSIDFDAWFLINSLLEKDPVKRWGGDLVRRDPLFDHLNWDKVQQQAYEVPGRSLMMCPPSYSTQEPTPSENLRLVQAGPLCRSSVDPFLSLYYPPSAVQSITAAATAPSLPLDDPPIFCSPADGTQADLNATPVFIPAVTRPTAHPLDCPLHVVAASPILDLVVSCSMESIAYATLSSEILGNSVSTHSMSDSLLHSLFEDVPLDDLVVADVLHAPVTKDCNRQSSGLRSFISAVRDFVLKSEKTVQPLWTSYTGSENLSTSSSEDPTNIYIINDPSPIQLSSRLFNWTKSTAIHCSSPQSVASTPTIDTAHSSIVVDPSRSFKTSTFGRFKSFWVWLKRV